MRWVRFIEETSYSFLKQTIEDMEKGLRSMAIEVAFRERIDCIDEHDGGEESTETGEAARDYRERSPARRYAGCSRGEGNRQIVRHSP